MASPFINSAPILREKFEGPPLIRACNYPPSTAAKFGRDSQQFLAHTFIHPIM